LGGGAYPPRKLGNDYTPVAVFQSQMGNPALYQAGPFQHVLYIMEEEIGGLRKY